MCVDVAIHDCLVAKYVINYGYKNRGSENWSYVPLKFPILDLLRLSLYRFSYLIYILAKLYLVQGSISSLQTVLYKIYNFIADSVVT